MILVCIGDTSPPSSDLDSSGRLKVITHSDLEFLKFFVPQPVLVQLPFCSRVSGVSGTFLSARSVPLCICHASLDFILRVAYYQQLQSRISASRKNCECGSIGRLAARPRGCAAFIGPCFVLLASPLVFTLA